MNSMVVFFLFLFVRFFVLSFVRSSLHLLIFSFVQKNSTNAKQKQKTQRISSEKVMSQGEKCQTKAKADSSQGCAHMETDLLHQLFSGALILFPLLSFQVSHSSSLQLLLRSFNRGFSPEKCKCMQSSYYQQKQLEFCVPKRMFTGSVKHVCFTSV